MASATRHVPQRTCVICRDVSPQRELHRLVRDPKGQVRHDATGRAPGRGAYVCHDCLGQEIKPSRLDHALRGHFSAENLSALRLELGNGAKT